MSPQNLWLGNININNLEKGLVSPSYKIYKFNGIEKSFFNPQLRTKNFLHEYKLASTQGASVVRRNLDLEAFENIAIFIPSIEEQKKIGVFFLKLNEAINLQKEKIELLQEEKKGFMQKMFI